MRRLVASFVSVCLGAALAPALGVSVAGAAHADGIEPEPTPGSGALTRARAALDDPAAAGDATLALRDLYLARQGVGEALSPAERRAADALLARPSDPPSSDDDVSWSPTAPRASVCGVRACIQYVTTTADAPPSDAWVQQNLATVEQSLAVEIDQLGYRAPASDGTLGGSPQFDVYLADLTPLGLYGYCAPEAPIAGQTYRVQSYCVFDNDFVGYPTEPASSLRVTAAHELFHAIQFNIDAGEDRWFLEATATWMEEQVAGDVDDNRQYLDDGQLGNPQLPLDAAQDLAPYGNWIFFQRLAQRYGVDAVRKVWDRADATEGKRDRYSVQAIDSYLRSKGSSLRAFYADFVAANLTPRTSYPEGAVYDRAPITQRARLGARKRSIGAVEMRVPHLASKSVRIKALRSLRGSSRLVVGVDARLGRATDPSASALVYLRSGKVKRVAIRLDRRGDGRVGVSFTRSRVRQVVVVVANGSTRYSSCFSGRTDYACLGVPKDDDQRFTVTARVVRRASR